MNFTPDEVRAARALVAAFMPPTPQYAWPLLQQRLGFPVWVKHENHTPAGAFKVRGGLTYFDALARQQPQVRGVISATRGNHGQSVAWGARLHGVHCTIVVPHGNSPEKNAAMRAFGATVVLTRHPGSHGLGDPGPDRLDDVRAHRAVRCGGSSCSAAGWSASS